MIHGASQHRGVFGAQVEYFQHHCRVLLIDLPGHGQKPASYDPADYADMASGLDAMLPPGVLDAVGFSLGGKVVLEGASFEEGTSVTVLARDEDSGVTLTPDEEAEILLAIAEAERGETVSAEEVLAKLARRHG